MSLFGRLYVWWNTRGAGPLALWRRYAKTRKGYGPEAYQLVLSDPDGLLPWGPGHDERLHPLQPALYLSPDKGLALVEA